MNSARGQIAEAHAAVADARREFDGEKTALARILADIDQLLAESEETQQTRTMSAGNRP